ncbi:MAG: hypothetical protein HBSIN02_18510 [Bacteroidia bacterium]|nr:MAG: hypothetical protein HBSIN02_18510 [Bacteroidia bacterium]
MADQQVVAAEQKILRVPGSMKSLIEALIFAAEEPLSVRQIRAIYEEQSGDKDRRLEQEEILSAIEALNEEYRQASRPYRIIAIAGGYQFATLKEYADWLGLLHREQSRRKLSQSSLETLAIVAYKQPITKPEIESIRGVNCDYVMKALLEKELITIVGRAESVGRPLLYGTTREFLKHFGLAEITDLPRPREIEEILGESEFETARRMMEAQAGAEQMKKEEEFKSRLPHIPKKKPELDDEVKIVPRGRPRTLTVRPKEDVPAIEAPPSPAPEPVAQEVSADTPFGPPAAESESPSAGAQEPLDQPAAADEDFSDESRVGRDELREETAAETHAEAVSLAIDEETTDVSDQHPSVPTVPPQEPEPSQPHTSAWTGWKQKIRNFIRKLFG